MLPRCSLRRRTRRTRHSIQTHAEDPDREQDLPEATEIEVLEALVAEPLGGSRRPAVNAGELADQAAADDEGERAEQGVRQQVLALRLALGDHRRQEDPGGQERRRDEEDRELHVPGAHEVVREPGGEVDAEEARQHRPGSAGRPRRRASGRRRAPPSRRRTTRSPAGRALARRHRGRGTTASAARGPASQGRASARTRRRAGRSRRAARSATARSRRSRSRSACCRRAARAASCSYTSSCGRAGAPRRPTPTTRRTRSACERPPASVTGALRSPVSELGLAKNSS